MRNTVTVRIPSRRFECRNGSSRKFWEVLLAGTQLITTWGKIGSAGQVTIKSFPTNAEALRAYKKLLDSKATKGYRETSSTAIPF
jgi:predicted DNA-binding WGR domain protein